MRFDFLVPFVLGRELGFPIDHWDDSRYTTFVQLRKGVTAAANAPTRGYLYSNTPWKWEGQDPREEILIRGACADVGFFGLLGIPILQGRDFVRTENLADTQWIINEEAARTNPAQTLKYE